MKKKNYISIEYRTDRYFIGVREVFKARNKIAAWLMAYHKFLHSSRNRSVFKIYVEELGEYIENNGSHFVPDCHSF